MLENRPTVSVVVMTFNEEATVACVVREIQDVLRGLEQPYEILAVNDGSSDGTAAQLAALARELPNVRVVTHEVNQGLGGVYRTGFGHACGRYVTFFPADGQFPATIIRQFLPLMDRQDMVLGYLPKRDGPWLSKILSYVRRVLYRVLFDSMPPSGILMFRRSLLAGYQPTFRRSRLGGADGTHPAPAGLAAASSPCRPASGRARAGCQKSTIGERFSRIFVS